MPSLYRHPDAPAGAIQSIDAELERMDDGAVAIFQLRGDISKLVIPPPAEPERADNLWRTTCFELFVAGEGTSYREFNFSPSGQWAAYQFDDYRSGMRNIDAQIESEVYQENNILQFAVGIRTEFPNPVLVGLTAVVEELGGTIGYWSTSFAPGKPDFHAAAVRSLLLDGVSAE
ncbi:DOMON-like domain-containing protein [Sphingomonas sp.]|uniref:DOMON-like domain-containing protein n=1 Tax=Sphingomonas sp. TaxID=28214 RepID=UPI0025D4707B|nr:DOMON-like domain-containing protein [Sphingomonas sp.]